MVNMCLFKSVLNYKYFFKHRICIAKHTYSTSTDKIFKLENINYIKFYENISNIKNIS